MARGRVFIGGRPTTATTSERDVAMVFEHTPLFSFLDVAENMSFGLRAHHVTKPEQQQRVEEEGAQSPPEPGITRPCLGPLDGHGPARCARVTG